MKDIDPEVWKRLVAVMVWSEQRAIDLRLGTIQTASASRRRIRSVNIDTLPVVISGAGSLVSDYLAALYGSRDGLRDLKGRLAAGHLDQAYAKQVANAADDQFLTDVLKEVGV